MKTRILNLLLPVLALTAAACGDSFEFGTPTHDLDEGTDLSAGTTQVLWKNKGAVYPTKRIHNFRIPGLVRTPHKLIAFCEAREETGSTNKDGGDIDLVYRVSTDDGQTWGPSQVLFDDEDNTCGNACAVWTESGRLVVFCCWARTGTTEAKFKSNYFSFEESQRYHNHVVSFYSDDEGATWSGPFKWFTENRNSDPGRYLWTGFFKAGPGHAIQLKTGEHKGRILVGCDHKYQVFGGTAVPADSEDENYYGSHIAYSDDNGESWHMLELDEELHYGNECVPVELSDGRIYLDMRGTGAYKKQRGWSVSGDGGITWSRYTPNPLRTDPGCQGSIVNYNTNGVPSSVILASSNNSTGRDHLSIRASLDDCATWKTDVYQITEGKSGYSDLVVFDDGSVGVLYENGTSVYREQISFRRIPAATIAKYINE